MQVLADPSLFLIQQALGDRYDIEAPIARGGMASVYLARDIELDRPVAIKALAPELVGDAARRERFLWEARTAAALTHPHIVPVHAVYEHVEWVAFVMGYVAGETLAQRVARGGPLAPADGARLLAEIGGALAYAHACGIVHRDVKPDNILLDTVTGHARLSDFGIALVSGESAPIGSIIGTPGFMSPEQARGEAVDARSDLYSLGVVAFYALTGRPLFEASSDEELLARHVEQPVPPVSSVAHGVPAAFGQIVDRCLAYDPDARFPNAAALVAALSDAVVPAAAPAPAVRAFLVRGEPFGGIARLHVVITGVVLLPGATSVWLTASHPDLRLAASLALALALLLPAGIAVARARQLLAAGHRREELVAALAAAHARRREELALAYGLAPGRVEIALQWITRGGVALAIGAVWMWTAAALPGSAAPLPTVAAAAAVMALLSAIAARARTELRTEPRSGRRARFWDGPLGRLTFRLAALGLRDARSATAVEASTG